MTKIYRVTEKKSSNKKVWFTTDENEAAIAKLRGHRVEISTANWKKIELRITPMIVEE